MSTGDTGVSFEEMDAPVRESTVPEHGEKSAADLEAVFDVPVRVSVVLGRTKMPVASLLKIDTGTVIELDRQVGEAVEIFVNDRLVARGEIVLVENRLGVTMTEIIKAQ
jgi:flagellar motor switch protein FliN/FliY